MTEINQIQDLYGLNDYVMKEISGHKGGRNQIYICMKDNTNCFVIRISAIGDRTEEEYYAETDFVHYLANGGASVADVIRSKNEKFVEKITWNEKNVFVSLFVYAKGMLISDNGYQYREGAPLTEYFYNTGKALGEIHRLSKSYQSVKYRPDYFEKYNIEYINSLIPDAYANLKMAINERLEIFNEFTQTPEEYGMVHFDFSDGNYHIDMSNGKLTVFDFDNCMKCWYMFDLANLWTHGVGWCQYEDDVNKRREFMKKYFDTIVEGYRSETDISEEKLEKLQLFIDMVLIENVVDEFECCERNGEELNYEDIEDAAECLINNIPFAGFFSE